MIYDVIYFDLGDTLVDNSSPTNWILGAHDAIDLLRQRGLRLGLISNTGTLTRQQLIEMLPPDFDLGLFDESLIILSSEVGVEKPAFDIFRLAVAKSCVAACRCLFCTEELFHTLAAQQVGMHVARLQTPPQGDVGSVPDLLQRLESLT